VRADENLLLAKRRFHSEGRLARRQARNVDRSCERHLHRSVIRDVHGPIHVRLPEDVYGDLISWPESQKRLMDRRARPYGLLSLPDACESHPEPKCEQER
jgi:hypothetical protein